MRLSIYVDSCVEHMFILFCYAFDSRFVLGQGKKILYYKRHTVTRPSSVGFFSEKSLIDQQSFNCVEDYWQKVIFH